LTYLRSSCRSSCASRELALPWHTKNRRKKGGGGKKNPALPPDPSSLTACALGFLFPRIHVTQKGKKEGEREGPRRFCVGVGPRIGVPCNQPILSKILLLRKMRRGKKRGRGKGRKRKRGRVFISLPRPRSPQFAHRVWCP